MEKVKLNTDMCIGCGMCTTIAKETFTFGEDHAELINDIATDKAKEAADACPVGAIEIINAD